MAGLAASTCDLPYRPLCGRACLTFRLRRAKYYPDQGHRCWAAARLTDGRYRSAKYRRGRGLPVLRGALSTHCPPSQLAFECCPADYLARRLVPSSRDCDCSALHSTWSALRWSIATLPSRSPVLRSWIAALRYSIRFLRWPISTLHWWLPALRLWLARTLSKQPIRGAARLRHVVQPFLLASAAIFPVWFLWWSRQK